MAFLRPFLPYIIAGLAIIALLFGVYHAGYSSCETKWNIEKAETAKKIAELEAHNQTVVTNEVIKYVDRIKYVKVAGKTITEYVPTYITKEVDRGCTINVGAVRLHNAAVQAIATGDPTELDATASGVALSQFTGTVVINYEICHENAAKLTALQNILRGVK